MTKDRKLEIAVDLISYIIKIIESYPILDRIWDKDKISLMKRFLKEEEDENS